MVYVENPDGWKVGVGVGLPGMNITSVLGEGMVTDYNQDSTQPRGNRPGKGKGNPRNNSSRGGSTGGGGMPSFPMGNPVIPFGPDADSDVFYGLIYNPFDPRVTSRGTDFTTTPFDLYNHALNQIEEKYFRSNSGSPVPEGSVVIEMLNSIIDISRLYGMALSFYACRNTIDTNLNNRNRTLNFNRNWRTVLRMLQELPLPSNLRTMVTRTVGLADVSAQGRHRLYGQLVAGDYDTFNAIFSNVASSGNSDRRRAYAALKSLYPSLGQVQDHTASWQTAQAKADATQMFINAIYKFNSLPGRSVPYVQVAGASSWVSSTASGGWMHSYHDVTNSDIYTLTRWAIPGSGIHGAGSLTNNYPAICVPKERNGVYYDAAMSNGNQNFDDSVPSAIDVEAASARDDFNLLAIRHGIQGTNNGSLSNVLNVDSGSGSGNTFYSVPDVAVDHMSHAPFGHTFGDIYVTEQGNYIAMMDWLLS